ncbi:MAG: hypothetical protein QW478_11880 [Candidatus Micrarchaeaceae archaeon]
MSRRDLVSGGQGADFFVTYAITDPSASNRTKGISAFIVDINIPGLKVETMYDLMSNRGGGTTRIVFKEAENPRGKSYRRTERRLRRIQHYDCSREVYYGRWFGEHRHSSHRNCNCLCTQEKGILS